MTKVQRSPDDEILLTELAFDRKDFITFEVNPVILVAEQEQPNPYGKFRCFLEPQTKEFFVEISDERTMEIFTKSALLNLMKLAEEEGAETMYVCVRKSINPDSHLRAFLFLGFEKLSPEEQKKISMTKTHGILKYHLKDDDDQDE